MNPTDVSIIIVNYHASRMINDCIDSIYDKTSGVAFEIIVVDNNTENLEGTLRMAGKPEVKLVQLAQNVGFGQACNAGVDVADGTCVLFLNPDTILVNNAVKVLFDFIMSTPDCGACGANLVDRRLKPAFSFSRYLPGYRLAMNQFLRNIPARLVYGSNYEYNHTSHPIRVPHISGASMMMKKDVFSSLGGFDKKYFLYYEETDLCRRLKEINLSCYSVPQAFIVHYEGETLSDKPLMRFERSARSRVIYYYSNFGRFKSNMLCGIFMLQITGYYLKNLFNSKGKFHRECLRIFRQTRNDYRLRELNTATKN